MFLISASLQLQSQTVDEPFNNLTDLYGKQISFNEITSLKTKTVIVFWNSSNKQHISYLDELNEQVHDDFNVIAICTNKYHNYQQLQAMASGKEWNIRLFVDVNEKFKRMNGISDDYITTLSLNTERIDSYGLITVTTYDPALIAEYY